MRSEIREGDLDMGESNSDGIKYILLVKFSQYLPGHVLVNAGHVLVFLFCSLQVMYCTGRVCTVPCRSCIGSSVLFLAGHVLVVLYCTFQVMYW